MAATLATLRYSYALLLPDDDKQASDLAGCCASISLAVAIVLGVGLALFLPHWDRFFKPEAPGLWVWLVPVSTFFAGIQLTSYTLANRERNFRRMSWSKMGQAFTTVLVSIALGLLLEAKALALIIGYVAGQFLSITILVPSLGKYFQHFKQVTAGSIRAAAARYRNFALVSVPSDFINTLTNQLPVFFIMYFFTEAILGQYNLTFRAAYAPLMILGVAILDVFKERAAREFAAKGNCRSLFLKTARTLAMISTPILVVVYPFAPALFAFVFGQEWRQAGEFAQILIPLFIIRFVVSPLSYMVYIAEKQIYDLIWQLGLLVVVFASFAIGGWKDNITLALHLFTWSYFAMYLIYFAINYYLTIRRTT